MSKIIVGSYIVGMVQTNFYYLHREDSRECIVFDPADLGGQIYEALEKEHLSVKAIFLTHAHYDHIWGVEELKEATGAPVYANILEEDLLFSPDLNHSALRGRPCTVKPDHWLHDGEEITIAGMTLKMIATPGHTKGSCCYYIDECGEEGDHILISGDTLFEESCGRTDLPTGSEAQIVRSIKEKLFALPDNTTAYPGHMGYTTIEHEKKFNFLV